jgi:hypothetical protein
MGQVECAPSGIVECRILRAHDITQMEFPAPIEIGSRALLTRHRRECDGEKQ